MSSLKLTHRPVAALLGLRTLLGLPAAVSAAETKIAVAANFTAAAQEIASRFTQDTGHKAVLIFGSTGKLYAQIYNAAPFDVFLAADSKRPKKAEAEGLATPGTSYTYATGRLALISFDPDLLGGVPLTDDAPKVLASDRFAKLAIANPKTAPYGEAAVEVMTKLGLYAQLAAKIVKGDNLSQVQQFVISGNAQLGFVALSQVNGDKSGSKWVVPDKLYSPIRQDAVLLKRGADNPAAKAFFGFLQSDAAKVIIRKYGYGLE